MLPIESHIHIDITKTTIKVATDKLELAGSVSTLKKVYLNLDLRNYISPFIKKEVQEIVKKISKKLVVPKKEIKSITFNYYQILALQYIVETQQTHMLDDMEFNQLTSKVLAKF